MIHVLLDKTERENLTELQDLEHLKIGLMETLKSIAYRDN